MPHLMLLPHLSVLRRTSTKIILTPTQVNRDVVATVQNAVSVHPLILRRLDHTQQRTLSYNLFPEAQEETRTVLSVPPSPLPSSWLEVATGDEESSFIKEILAGRQKLRKVSTVNSDALTTSLTGEGRIMGIPQPPPLPSAPKGFSSVSIPPPPPLPPTPKIRSAMSIPPPPPLPPTLKNRSAMAIPPPPPLPPAPKTVSKVDASSCPSLPPKPKSYSAVGIPPPPPSPPPMKAASAVGIPPPPPPTERAISAMDIPSPLSCEQKMNSPATSAAPLCCASEPLVTGYFAQRILEGKKKLKKVSEKKPEGDVGGGEPDQNLSTKDSIIKELSRALRARRRAMCDDD